MTLLRFDPLWLALSAICLGLAHIVALELLRRNHYRVWQSLGEPSLVSSSTESKWAFQSWFFSGKFRTLSDRKFVVFLKILRASDVVWVVSFATLLVIDFYLGR